MAHHGHGAYVQTAEPSDSQWAATVAVRAEGLLLRDNVERAGEPGSGGPTKLPIMTNRVTALSQLELAALVTGSQQQSRRATDRNA